VSSSRGHARRLGRSSAPPRTNRSCRGCRVAPTTAIRAYRPSMRPVLKVAKGSEAQIQTGPLPAVRLDGRLEGDNDRGCDRSRPELRVGCKGMKAVRRWLRRVLRSMGKAGCDEATSGLHVRAPVPKGANFEEAFRPNVSPIEELARLVGGEAWRKPEPRRDNARRRRLKHEARRPASLADCGPARPPEGLSEPRRRALQGRPALSSPRKR